MGLAALAGGSGGGQSAETSQSSALELGDFGGGTRGGFGPVNIGSGSATATPLGLSSSSMPLPYLIGGIALLAVILIALRK